MSNGTTANELIESAKAKGPKMPDADAKAEIKKILHYNDTQARTGAKVKVDDARQLLRRRGFPLSQQKFKEWVSETFNREDWNTPR